MPCRSNLRNRVPSQHGGSWERLYEEQMEWLRMIREHIVSSFQLDRDNLNMAPFNSQGGMGRMCKPFGDRVDGVIKKWNEALAG